jgi:GntR family transcriptional repressor for pyruvate dehydrogenase complex
MVNSDAGAAEVSGHDDPAVLLSEVAHQRLHARVADSLRGEIARGIFAVGDKLPSERNLAKMLNVSRTVLRDALAALELDGTIEIRPRMGIVVTRVQASTGGSVESEPGTLEIIEARLVLERELAAAAATRISSADLARLDRRLEIMGSVDILGYERSMADREFHQIIAESSGNGLMAGFVTHLMTIQHSSRIWQQVRRHWPQSRNRERLVQVHKEIVDGLRSGNPNRARGAVEVHMLGLFEDIQHAAGDALGSERSDGYWIDRIK